MNAPRPALAYHLKRIEDEPWLFGYSDELQISIDAQGDPVMKLGSSEIQTFAESDAPKPTTDTRAERDPGDLEGSEWSLHDLAETQTITEASHDRDAGDPEPERFFDDDPITGVVTF
jgi:hypothetical protein